MDKKLATIKTNTLTPEQIELVKNTVAKGATNDELQLFLYTAERTKLDPLTKQIYFVKRANQMTIQTGIDGYRAIAERSGTLAGIDDAVFDSEDKSHPNKATVTVHRIIQNLRVAYTASARWTEYAPQGGQAFMWQKMPYLMLGKCAEALALRKAFPNDLSGIYTTEEMQQSENTKINVVDHEVETIVEVPATAPVKPTTSPVQTFKPIQPIHQQPPMNSDALKTKIKELCLLLKPTVKTKEEYENLVIGQTGFKLEPKNYQFIIKTLQHRVDAMKENEISVEDVEREFSGEDKKIMDALSKD